MNKKKQKNFIRLPPAKCRNVGLCVGHAPMDEVFLLLFVHKKKTYFAIRVCDHPIYSPDAMMIPAPTQVTQSGRAAKNT